MKKQLFIYIVFIFSIIITDAATVLAQASALDYGGDTERVPSEISLDIKAGKYEIIQSEYMLFKQKQSGLIIRMKGFNAMTSPGDPVLPIHIYEIALPPNVDYETISLSVETGETKMLTGEFDILPAPPMLTRVDKEELVDWGHGKDIVDGYNMTVYGKDEYFPRKSTRLVSHSQLRKWRFAQVLFSPFQYNPVRKSVRMVQSVKLTFSFMRIGKHIFRSDPLLADSIMDEEVKKRFINFKEAQKWYRYVPGPGSDASVSDTDYAIVTTNAIRDNSTKLADFVSHKTALGHGVQIVTEDDYGMTGSAEAIRQWLVTNYAELGIHYVLLVGNPDPDDPDSASDSVGDVPMVMGWPYRFFTATGNLRRIISLPTLPVTGISTAMAAMANPRVLTIPPAQMEPSARTRFLCAGPAKSKLMWMVLIDLPLSATKASV